ncbi:MAG: FAD-binding protein [Angelakisella sp.]
MKKFASIILAIALTIMTVTGCSNTAPAPSSQSSEAATPGTSASAYDKEVDFLVIGGGGAGLAAAIEAHDNGVKNIMIVEKMGTIGGTTFISQGMIAGYDSQVQKAEPSVPTNYAEMYTNLMNNATYRLDPDLTKVTVERSGQTIDWLANRMQVPFKSDVLVGYGPLEMMHVVENGGQGMLEPFQKELEKAGIQVMTETTANEIVTDETGKPVAVTCTTKDGDITIGAKAIMIATGGYANNPALTELLDPEFAGTFGLGFGTCKGDGLVMANNIGAAVTHTSHLMAVLKDYEIMANHNGTSASASVKGFTTKPQNLIFVGSEGKRFTNERDQGYMSQDLNSPIFDQMHKDGLGYVWAISDEATIQELKIERASEMSYVKADTVEELAKLTDVDAAGLAETIKNYNSYVAAGFDPEFKRTATEGLTKLTAPYVALSIVPCEIITYGGIARNEWSEVLRADGSVVEGLYVAGEAAANSAYMGFTISNAFTWGRIAGQSAADYILGNEKKPSPIGKTEAEVPTAKTRFDMSTPLKDGEYTATVSGQEGDMTVKTVITEGKISAVEVVSQHETEAIAKGALENIPGAVTAANSADVDVVSGATLTSNRLMDAVAACLQQAVA